MENVVRVESNPLHIGIFGPGVQDWEPWLIENGFLVCPPEDAQIILWVDPDEEDWSQIIKDRRVVVIGSSEIIDRCEAENIAHVKHVSNAQSIRETLEQHVKLLEMLERELRKSYTLPPKSKVEKPVKRPTLIRQSTKDTLPKIEEILEEEIPVKYTNRKEILIGFPPINDTANKLSQYIQKESAGTYRVLEVSQSFAGIIRSIENGKYDVILIHRKLPGLEENLVENVQRVRDKAPSSRIIILEKQSDYFTTTYKDRLDSIGVEWQIVSRLPGPIMNILRGTIGDEGLDLEWDTEPVLTTALTVTETKVHRPMLLVTHSAGGGIGKSTAAQQLGFAFASKGYKTLIIEFDPEKPSLARGTGAPANCPGLADWVPHEDFKNEANALNAIKRTSAQVNGLYVLPVGPISPKKAVLPFYLEGEGDAQHHVEIMLNAALSDFQIVIVDTNPILEDPAVFAALNRAHIIFYLMEGTKVFLDSAKAHIDEAEAHGVDLSRYRIILNKYTNKEPLSKREITQTLEKEISLEVPLDVDGYRKAADKGIPYKPPKGISPWVNYVEKFLEETQIQIINGQNKSSFFSRIFPWGRKSK